MPLSLSIHRSALTDRVRRRLPILAAAALLALAALPARAQDIPVSPRPQRPQQPQRPAPGRPQPPRAGADTVPEDSARRGLPQDSTIEALLRLPGYEPVEYQGDSAQFNNRERTLRLRGSPVVTRGTTRLEARDSIVYRERSDFVEVYGDAAS